MRPLTEDETAVLFEKLSRFIGRSLRHLLERPDGDFCFRFHHDRVFYMSADVLRQAQHVSNDNLLSAGTCLGKFTKTGKFRLHVTALDYLAQYAKNRVWVKPSSEMSFLYGNHVLKSGLGRITESTAKYQGVVVMSMSDIPLGFGVTAHGTQDCRKLEPSAIVSFHQGDTGEYLRQESDLI